MDPMTLLVSAIGSLSVCIAYLYKQQERRADALQKKYDDLVEFQKGDMAKMCAKYVAVCNDYNRIVRSEQPHDAINDSDATLKAASRSVK